MYKKVDAEILSQVEEIAGRENVVVDAERLERYAHDETVGLRAEPEVVVRATSAQQVAGLLKLANRLYNAGLEKLEKGNVRGVVLLWHSATTSAVIIG